MVYGIVVGNNPIKLVDPDGKLGFFWHAGLTYLAARGSGYGYWDSVKLAWNTTLVDFGSQGQNPEDTVKHAMASRLQSSEQAIAATYEYIQYSIDTDNLADAIHAAQDLATPEHAGQPWEGFAYDWKTVNHLEGDIFPSWSTIKQATSNTMDILNGNWNRGISK